MDHHFLTEVADAFLVTNDVYSKYSRKEIKQIRERITEEVLTLIKDLRETDLELYDMLWDRSKVFQQQVITDYLTLTFCDEETINEIGIVLGGVMVLSAIAGFVFRDKFSDYIMKKVEKIGIRLEKFGKRLIRYGRFAKFRYAIIQRNIRICYNRCDVKKEDITGLHYLSVRGSSITKTGAQVKCLRECYLIYSIDTIVLLLNYYFVCIKKQNQFQSVERLSPDDILKIVTGVPLAGACKDFFDQIKEHFDTFYDLLDFIYKDDEQGKQSAIMKLKDRVIKIRNEVSKTKDFKKYK